MPLNIGIVNDNINKSISEYNALILDRNKKLVNLGPNNIYFKNIDLQINNIYKNVVLSVKNYQKTLSTTIKNLKANSLNMIYYIIIFQRMKNY